MSKRCKHIEKDGFHHCGSYAFNLYKDGIEQGDLCDVHYWQDQALSARTRLADAALDKMADNARELGLSYEQPCKYGNEPASCTSSPMDCQCAIDAALEQPAPAQPAPAQNIPSMCAHDWVKGIKNETWCARCGKIKDDHFAGGGKPMAEQPAQQDPDRVKFERHWRKTRGEKKANRELPRHPLQPQTYIQDSANRHWVTWQAAVMSVAPPAPAQPCKYGNEPASCTSSPMDCQCAIDATHEQPAPAQEPDPDELTIAYMSGVYEGKKAERQRIVNLLMIQHEAAKGAHNYWHVAANLIQAEVASDT